MGEGSRESLPIRSEALSNCREEIIAALITAGRAVLGRAVQLRNDTLSDNRRVFSMEGVENSAYDNKERREWIQKEKEGSDSGGERSEKGIEEIETKNKGRRRKRRGRGEEEKGTHQRPCSGFGKRSHRWRGDSQGCLREALRLVPQY